MLCKYEFGTKKQMPHVQRQFFTCKPLLLLLQKNVFFFGIFYSLALGRRFVYTPDTGRVTYSFNAHMESCHMCVCV